MIRNLTSMQAIGYKEILSYLKGEISFAESIQLIKREPESMRKGNFHGLNECETSIGLI